MCKYQLYPAYQISSLPVFLGRARSDLRMVWTYTSFAVGTRQTVRLWKAGTPAVSEGKDERCVTCHERAM